MILDKARMALVIEALAVLLEKDQFDCPEDRDHARQFQHDLYAEFGRTNEPVH